MRHAFIRKIGYEYVQQGRLAEAAAEFHTFEGQAFIGARSPLRLAGLGYASAVLGRKTEALRIVGQMERENVLPYDIGYIFAALGEKDMAFNGCTELMPSTLLGWWKT